LKAWLRPARKKHKEDISVPLSLLRSQLRLSKNSNLGTSILAKRFFYLPFLSLV
jgi:hypothetical protein